MDTYQMFIYYYWFRKLLADIIRRRIQSVKSKGFQGHMIRGASIINIIIIFIFINYYKYYYYYYITSPKIEGSTGNYNS